MSEQQKPVITVQVTIAAPVEKVWQYFTDPVHIVKWNSASEDWHTPFAEADLKPGGNFLSRMEAKDGSIGFDFKGTYEVVEQNSKLAYILEDGREVSVVFSSTPQGTQLVEKFEAENQNSLELQQFGWQSILESFKRYVEGI